ncbi:MAG: FAD-binding protein [Chitinophagaceae bacterium]|nr:MAG: FAD-binding protein [Chitinophagaceae bacterium]
MQQHPSYEVAIIGGGLAGLALSIQLAKAGKQVILFEKEQYPFHKVCGEYISMESWNFMEGLGVPLRDLNLPRITNLTVSSPSGKQLHAPLQPGGFGISRYLLDGILKDLAVQAGVKVVEQCKVADVQFKKEGFEIDSTAGQFFSKVCCGSFGKRSNLDVKWKRSFTQHGSRKLNHFTGVKYHIETTFPADSIALHNFKDGYCGISKIEGEKYCLCYLTHTDNLKKNGQSIAAMEQNVLSRNPHLRAILNNSTVLYDAPVSISQISFLQKTQVENHVLLLGDAAGLITPLCGNGMSMALHGAKLLAPLVLNFLNGICTRSQMETAHIAQWRWHFASRLRYGRIIQYFFGNETMTNIFIAAMQRQPWFTRWLIARTHGKSF